MIRPMVGYGTDSPQIQWPHRARLAINFVINYEEGAELSPVNGDKTAEIYGGEYPLASKPRGKRSLSMESLFEYGSRAGLWRLIRLFDSEKIAVTFFITGYALRLNPQFSSYLRSANHDIAGHGWRWFDYAQLSFKEEKAHILNCIKTVEELTGIKIQGWYTGRRSESTRPILQEIGGFLYDSDSYSDDFPYFENNHLIIPYSLVCNDFRFSTSPGFNTADDFFSFLKNTFDYLYEENRHTMMTIGLHPRFSGHPGRCVAVKQFIHYLKQFSDIWIAHRLEIAEYWHKQFASYQSKSNPDST